MVYELVHNAINAVMTRGAIPMHPIYQKLSHQIAEHAALVMGMKRLDELELATNFSGWIAFGKKLIKARRAKPRPQGCPASTMIHDSDNHIIQNISDIFYTGPKARNNSSYADSSFIRGGAQERVLLCASSHHDYTVWGDASLA